MGIELGTIIGDYRVISELGGGGMATVYRVEHTALDTHHALKVLAPEYRVNEEARRRFLEEAKIQAKYLDHPGIVKVTGIVSTEEVAGLVMELVEGESLADFIEREGAQPAERIRAIMLPVLHAVAHAHDAGIIHRDIKPGNVLLTRRGERLVPKLTDFGIAKVGDRVDRKLTTRLAARMGTLGFMSPEQIRHAKHVTERSDVFSLGAVLYELATGREAFPGESEYDVMESIIHARYLPPEQAVAGLDPAIAATIHCALRSDPDARFADARAMSASLSPGGAAAIAPPAAVSAPARGRGSSPWLAIAIAVVAIAVAGGGVGLYVAFKPRKPAVSDQLLAQLEGDLSRRPPRTRYVAIPVGDAPTTGDDDALLTVILVADYWSRESRRLQPTLQQLMVRYDDDTRLAITWISRPGLSEHAARLAKRAQGLGKFWDYHRNLINVSPYRSLTDDDVDQAWSAAGLSISSKLELESEASNAAWQGLQRELAGESVTVTPTLIVNGEVIEGVQEFDTYVEVFERQLDEAKAAVDRGVPRAELYERLTAAIRK